MAWRLSAIDRDRYAESAALLSAAALVALAAWLLVRLIWFLVPRGDAALDVPVRTAESGGPAPSQSVAKWHLFGNTPPRPGASSTAVVQGMILRGTLADNDPRAGVAVISSDSGERAFRVGEAVGAGMTLTRVFPDRVMLTHDGVEETLTLPRDQNLAPGDVVRPTAASVTRSSGANAARSTSASSTPSTRAPTDWQQTVERLRQNPEELAKRVQIVPVLDNGKLSGVRISAGTDTALIHQIGLRPGDIVTSVNGAPVDSVARGQQILDSLRTASSARVTVLRDGKPTDVTVSLK